MSAEEIAALLLDKVERQNLLLAILAREAHRVATKARS